MNKISKIVISKDGVDTTYALGEQSIPVDEVNGNTYGIYNKEISICDKVDSNDEILLTGQQVMVLDHSGNRVGRLTSVMPDAIASMYAANGDILDGDNQPTQYNVISVSSGDSNDGASVNIQSSFNGGESGVSAILNAMNLVFSKNVANNVESIQIGFDNENLSSEDVNIIITHSDNTKSYYAIKADKLNNTASTPAYLATESYVLQHAGSIDDQVVASTSTWSSQKISEELNKSDNIKYYSTKEEWRLDESREVPCICYIQELNKIVFDNGAEIAEPYDWNMSNSNFSSLGSINSVTTVDNLTLNPGVSINAYRTTINNVDYTYRLYFSNSGSQNSNSVSFNLTGNDEIEILFQAGGNNRTLRLEKEDGTVIRTFTGTTAQWHTFQYIGEACKAYLYMVSGTGYIYNIKLNV